MRNNKQDLLTTIRIDMDLLGYDDERMVELFGKTYKQIARLNYDEVKEIKNTLHKRYKEIQEHWKYIKNQAYNN